MLGLLHEAVELLNARVDAYVAGSGAKVAEDGYLVADSTLVLSGLDLPAEELAGVCWGFAEQTKPALAQAESVDGQTKVLADALRQAFAIGVVFEQLRRKQEAGR